MKNKIRAWMLFDFAAQPYHTLVVTFIFMPYFNSSIASSGENGQMLVSVMGIISAIIVAFSAPVISAITDQAGHRKRWMLFFSGIFIVSSFGLLLEHSIVALILSYSLAYAAIDLALVTINAYLPDFEEHEDIGKISGDAWGYGYVGGLILLAVFLLFLLPAGSGTTTLIGLPAVFDPSGALWAGPASAIWYLVFMIPFFLLFKNEPGPKTASTAVRDGLSSLKASLVKSWKDARLRWFFISSLLYRDALAGLFMFGSIYAMNVLGWPMISVSPFSVAVYGILLNVTGIFGGLIGGYFDKKKGPYFVVRWSLVLFIILCFVMMSTNRESVMFMPVAATSTLPDWVFFFCGLWIGVGVGSIQGAGRGMVVPETKGKMLIGEAFGIYGMMGRATAFIAPALVLMITAITRNSQYGVWPIFGLFVIAALCFRKFETTPR